MSKDIVDISKLSDLNLDQLGDGQKKCRSMIKDLAQQEVDIGLKKHDLTTMECLIFHRIILEHHGDALALATFVHKNCEISAMQFSRYKAISKNVLEPSLALTENNFRKIKSFGIGNLEQMSANKLTIGQVEDVATHFEYKHPSGKELKEFLLEKEYIKKEVKEPVNEATNEPETVEKSVHLEDKPKGDSKKDRGGPVFTDLELDMIKMFVHRSIDTPTARENRETCKNIRNKIMDYFSTQE